MWIIIASHGGPSSTAPQPWWRPARCPRSPCSAPLSAPTPSPACCRPAAPFVRALYEGAFGQPLAPQRRTRRACAARSAWGRGVRPAWRRWPCPAAGGARCSAPGLHAVGRTRACARSASHGDGAAGPAARAHAARHTASGLGSRAAPIAHPRAPGAPVVHGATQLTDAHSPLSPPLDSYVNGGQDWKTATPLCGTSVVQSPINVPSQIVNYSVSSLLPLNVSYGTSSDWMLEVTGARPELGTPSLRSALPRPAAAATLLRARLTVATPQPTTWRLLTSTPTPPA